MRVMGTVLTEMNISDQEIKRITISTISKIYDVKPDCYIKDGWLCIDEEQRGSHSWYETLKIRQATEDDVIAISVLKKIRK